MTRMCLLCSQPLPKRPWWKRLFTWGPDTHPEAGADEVTMQRCYHDFRQKLGMGPGVMPDFWRDGS